MLGTRDHLFARPALDNLSGVHDQRFVREIPRAGDVVGDVKYREVLLFFQALEQIEHLQTDRHVQHRDWFVGEQDGRLHRERPRNRDTLALSAAQLMRVLAQKLLCWGQAHPFQQRCDAV